MQSPVRNNFWRPRFNIFHMVATSKHCPILFNLFCDFFISRSKITELRNPTLKNKDHPSLDCMKCKRQNIKRP